MQNYTPPGTRSHGRTMAQWETEHHSARSFRARHGVASRIINVARKLRSSVRAGYIHDSISLPVRGCATSICHIELTISLANSPSAHAGQFAAQPLIKEASGGRANIPAQAHGKLQHTKDLGSAPAPSTVASPVTSPVRTIRVRTNHNQHHTQAGSDDHGRGACAGRWDLPWLLTLQLPPPFLGEGALDTLAGPAGTAWRRFSSTVETAHSRSSRRVVLRPSAAIDASRPVSSSCPRPTV